MVAILDALRGRVKQREGNALDTIAAAARAAARGETYDVGAIEKALAETRQTPGDFERAVELARKRLAWLADFEKLASATTKVTKLESTAEAEKAKFEAARRAFMEKADALDADLRTARTLRDKGSQARDQLLDPRDVPGTIGEKYREAVAEKEAADVMLEGAARDLREIVAKVKSEEGWIKQLTAEDEKELRPDRIFTKSAKPPEESYKVEDHRRALARAQRRRAEAEAQLTEAEKIAARAARAVEAIISDVLKA
jgi:hypothetical protein